MVTAAEKEVFSTPGWNFVGGDRQIEAILRDLPAGAPVVLRNRLANVLATAAGLADLGRVNPREPLKLSVRVPRNALVEPALRLDEPCSDWLGTLLGLYQLAASPPDELAPPGSLVVAAGFTEDGPAAALADWLACQPDLPLVLLAPAGQKLAAPLWPFAATAWTADVWDGLNAFMLTSVEAAVEELYPRRIYVAAARPEALLHTAIGAVDYWQRRLQREGGSPCEAVRHVGLLGVPRLTGPARPLIELVLEHLEAIGVASTVADARFAATGEAIAIDLV